VTDADDRFDDSRRVLRTLACNGKGASADLEVLTRAALLAIVVVVAVEFAQIRARQPGRQPARRHQDRCIGIASVCAAVT